MAATGAIMTLQLGGPMEHLPIVKPPLRQFRT